MKKVFDIHCHYTFDIPLDKTVDIFKREFKETGVYKSAFLSVPYEYINDKYEYEELQNLKALYLKKAFSPNAYAFAALTHPNKADYSNVNEVKADFLNQVETYFKVGYDGIKMLEGYPSLLKYRKQKLTDEVFDDFYAFMQEKGYPILIHIANPEKSWNLSLATPENVRLGRVYDCTFPTKQEITNQVFAVMDKFPHLKLILAHFGFLTYNITELERFLGDYPNTAIDITPGGENYFNMLNDWNAWQNLLNKYRNRIFYGSDFYAFPDENEEEWRTCFTRRPNFIRNFFETDTTHYYINDKFKGVKLNESLLENIYYKNAENLLKTPKKIDENYMLTEANRLLLVKNKKSQYANYDLEYILKTINN